jgi:hypothetical protein
MRAGAMPVHVLHVLAAADKLVAQGGEAVATLTSADVTFTAAMV